MYNSLYGNFRNRTFSNIWESAEDFVADYKGSGVYVTNNKISDASATSLFYLLYSEYGDSVISSDNEDIFRYQIFSTIFEYGPSWEKKLDIQNKLRTLTDNDLELGTKTIYNKALNPGTSTTTAELDYINEQNTATIKRGKLDKYAQLYEILDNDITKQFISKFKKYFLQIVLPERPLWYTTHVEEDEGDVEDND